MAYEGSEELNVASKNGKGTYEYIGYEMSGKSAIYAQSQEDYEKGQKTGARSVILQNFHGSKNWIGTVIIVLPQYRL